MIDHVFGDFDTPRSYELERCFTTARGFGSDKQPVSHIPNPGYYRLKFRYRYGKFGEPLGIHLPYQSFAVVHSYKVCLAGCERALAEIPAAAGPF
jgi:hypothetical protein